MKRMRCSGIGFVIGMALLGVLPGCTTHVDQPRHVRGYAQPPPGYVETVVVMQPEYVYYPGYQVYYSSHTRRYVYLDGQSWVSRSSPPRVPVNVLVASPSVRLDFHDSPAMHHAAVVRQYPKHWAPPGGNSNLGQGHWENGKDNDQGGRDK